MVSEVSIVIPLFNEDVVCAELWEALEYEQRAWLQTSEFIFVDDGSTDNTLQQHRDRKTQHKRKGNLTFSEFWTSSGNCAGLKYSKGDAVILMDGDLQDPPEVISRFLENGTRA